MRFLSGKPAAESSCSRFLLVGLLVFAKLQWRAANFLPEAADVVACCTKAVIIGDAADCRSGKQQGFYAAFDAVIQQVIKNCAVHVLLEKAAAFTITEVDFIGNFLQRELFAIMQMDEGKDCLDPCIILFGK